MKNERKNPAKVVCPRVAGCVVTANRRPERPSYVEVVELAVFMGKPDYVDPGWIYHPTWQAPPPGGAAMLRIAAKYRAWAALILSRKAPPPAWILESPEGRELLRPAWLIVPKVKKSPPPPKFRRFGDEPLRRVRTWPLPVAWLLREGHSSTGHSPPAFPRPPPCRPAETASGRGGFPTRGRIRDPVPFLPFDNRIAVYDSETVSLMPVMSAKRANAPRRDFVLHSHRVPVYFAVCPVLSSTGSRVP